MVRILSNKPYDDHTGELFKNLKNIERQTN